MLLRASGFALALALALAALAHAHSEPLRLLHRVFHPSLPDVPFSPRGALLLDQSNPARPTASLAPSDSLHADLLSFANALKADGPNFNDALYQVALEHPGDESSAQWHISSVKACHLAQSMDESITVHVSADGTPYALDYFVGPIPHNGACPKKKDRARIDVFDLKPFANSTVTVRQPTFPPLPQLRTPPPITPEGKVVEPVPEKNFIQKYWVYILIAVIALVMSPGPPEEDGKGGAKK